MDTQDQDDIDVKDDAPVDRKELLSRQLEEVTTEVTKPEAEEKPAKVEKIRDAAGKFTAADPAPNAASEPVWKRPPSSWKRDYHEVWNTADPRLQEYAHKREEEMRAGLEPLRSKAQFADQMNEVMKPYMQTIQGLGIGAPQAVEALMKADHTLRYGNAEQKQAYLASLARAYGINLGAVAAAPQGAPVDPTYYALRNEVNSVRGEMASFKRQREEADNQAALAEINDFAQTAEHFEEARPAMIQLLNSGMANNLTEAYTKAIRLDESISERIEQGRQAEASAQKIATSNKAAKAAKAAAVSVKSSTPGTRAPAPAQDRRSMLNEQFDSLNERF